MTTAFIFVQVLAGSEFSKLHTELVATVPTGSSSSLIPPLSVQGNVY